MRTALVGYTGFVGSNLCASHGFDACYNSQNIAEAYGANPDLLVYAGVRAEMFTANHFPEEDLKNIEIAFENIKKINPGKLVLISTISVYPDLTDGSEDTIIDAESLPAYGKNRYHLEQLVSEHIPGSLVVRLPALYGNGIKKNFIYDIIHYIPQLLKAGKYAELFHDSPLASLYTDRGDGFYQCVAQTPEDRKALKRFFKEKGFSALNFTDSRSRYQFFNLANLWGLIERSLHLDLPLLTITSAPLGVAELYEQIYHQSFVNEVNPNYPNQNLKSKYASLFGGVDGYLYSREEVMADVIRFIRINQE